MQLIELAALAQKVFPYDLTEVVTTGIIGNRVDAISGSAGQKLWQTSKQWYKKKVADLDVPVNATLQRAIRRSYLTSLVQTCDESILFIRRYETGDEYLTSQRSKLQALYHTLKRTLPALCSFPLSDADYQIQLIEAIRTHLTPEIDQVATQENLPDNPADGVFDQLVLWDYTHELNERQLLLQDEVHGFVLHELQTTRGLDVPEALETLLRLGWLHKGEKQTFFELMCRNFSEEIKYEKGVSEIFNAKLLAMLGEKMEVVEKKVDDVLQVVESNQAGIGRLKDQITTLPEEVADRVVAKMAALDFNLYEKHRQLNAQLSEMDAVFTELSPRKQKIELKIETIDDDETRELLAENLKELSIKLLNIDQDRASLRKELTVFEDDVLTLALSLYSKPTDSPRLQLALALFEQGDIEGANNILDPEDLEKAKIKHEAKKNLARKVQADVDNEGKTLAQEYLTKAKLIVLAKSDFNWFAEATYYYAEAVNFYEDYSNCFAAAYFLHIHNRYTTAAHYYELALKFVANDYQKANTLDNLANLHSDTQQLARAELEYEEALKIHRKLAAVNPEAHLPDVATTLNNFAVLHKDIQQLERAEAEYAEALGIRRKLAEANPEAHLSDVAMTLNNLANLHSDTQQMGYAEDEYIEALDICRRLGGANPDAYLPDVAATLNNLAILHSDTQQMACAEAEYTEALDIRRKLAAANPEAHLPDVAMILNNLALLHKDIQQLGRAEAEYEEALDIRRTLAAANQDAYMPHVATTLNNLANLHRATQQIAQAKAEHGEALDICRKLAVANPEAFLPYVASTLNNLALLHSDTQQMAQAEAEHGEALDIRRRLAEANPDTYMPDLADTLNNLANLHFVTQKIAQAEAEHGEALDIRRRLAADNPETYLPGVAMTLNNLAVLHKDIQQLGRAEAEYAEALDIRRTLAAANPDAYLPSVAMTLNNLAILHRATQQMAQAETEHGEALDIRRRLAADNPDAYLPDVATTLNNLAILHRTTQKIAQAEAEHGEALDIRRRLAADNPDAYLPDVATTLNNLANLHKVTQQVGRSEDEYAEALDIRKLFAKRNPSAFQLDFAKTLICLGLFYQEKSVADKEKSLDFSLQAYQNSETYRSEVPLAKTFCDMAVGVWQHWREDLQKYLQDGNEDK